MAKHSAANERIKRDRALIVFTLQTGARDGALASLKLKHVDLNAGRLDQDARDVKTKFCKTFSTWFFPVGDDVRKIVDDWCAHLRDNLHWGECDPLFPATQLGLSEAGGFVPIGLRRDGWTSAAPVRDIFRKAFEGAGLPYFNPHSFRDTLVQLGQRVCTTLETFKAWSLNLGHEHMLTTLTSYGAVSPHRQAELIRGLSKGKANANRRAALAARLADVVEEFNEIL
jgi:integrase